MPPGPHVGNRHPDRQRHGDDPPRLVSSVVAPALIMPIATVFACGIVPGVVMSLYGWKILSAAGDLPMPEVKNPTELKTAISFGLLYALVLLASAWLQDIAGNKGLYIVASPPA
jgi:uncharacterized membrane protein (DUF4010 family)